VQTQTQIREMLADAGLAPNRALGQNFLVDLNLLGKLLELADVGRQDVILEIGPGTGSLTEELADRAERVVAVEIDRGLHGLLLRRFEQRPNVTILHADALAGKHELSPAMIGALGPRASLVANLPYNVATPLVAQCLLESVRSSSPCRFDRLTFTVQREVADRMSAGAEDPAYGPLSVIVGVLGRLTPGPVVPPSAFWPRPAVSSRIVRIDFDPQAASRVLDPDDLSLLVASAFAQRRKQIGALLRREACPFPPQSLQAAFERSGVERTLRAEQISPPQYLEMANALSRKRQGRPE
jgi:16S rRNA (adenine1518-N6/adenine1519-N6)-dimethyltransferase